MRDPVIQTRMRQGAIIGAIVGVALFGVGSMAYHSLVYAVFIPITAAMGYFAPSLLAGDDY